MLIHKLYITYQSVQFKTLPGFRCTAVDILPRGHLMNYVHRKASDDVDSCERPDEPHEGVFSPRVQTKRPMLGRRCRSCAQQRGVLFPRLYHRAYSNDLRSYAK